jgi:hypothetical protein
MTDIKAVIKTIPRNKFTPNRATFHKGFHHKDTLLRNNLISIPLKDIKCLRTLPPPILRKLDIQLNKVGTPKLP